MEPKETHIEHIKPHQARCFPSTELKLKSNTMPGNSDENLHIFCFGIFQDEFLFHQNSNHLGNLKCIFLNFLLDY